MKTGGSALAGLDTLEEKIKKTAELIARLKKEKGKAEELNKELKERSETLYIKNEELTKEIENLKMKEAKGSDFDKTREEIKRKIEEMLAKMEELDI